MAQANLFAAQSHVLQCSPRSRLAAAIAVYIAAIIVVAATPSATAASDESITTLHLTTLHPHTSPHDHTAATESTPLKKKKKNSKPDLSGDHQAQEQPTHPTTHHPHKGARDHTATSHLPTHPTTAAHHQQKPPAMVPEEVVKCAEKKQGWNKLGNGRYVRCKYANGPKSALLPERCGCDPLWRKGNEVAIPSVEVCPGFFYEIHQQGWICVCPRSSLKTEFGGTSAAKERPTPQGKEATNQFPRTCK